MTISPRATNFILRTLAAVTPQPIFLSATTPSLFADAVGRLGFQSVYAKESIGGASALWGVLYAHRLTFEETLRNLQVLGAQVTDGGWIILAVDEAVDAERWASARGSHHPVLESHGFALAADVSVESRLLTTIVRKLSSSGAPADHSP